MVSYIIVCRNPSNNKLIVITEDDGETPAEFETEEAAYAAAEGTSVCRSWGAEIVPIDR